MTHDRGTHTDAELASALRALYAAPADESYWDALEARILARIARDGEAGVWWAELADMMRPSLVAAAALIIAATLAMARSQQTDARNAYASVVSAPASVEMSSTAGSIGDGDMAVHYLLSR
ncbi:MAG TPA: hypothetical protein VF386_05385 [Usitatibacter sp.]